MGEEEGKGGVPSTVPATSSDHERRHVLMDIYMKSRHKRPREETATREFRVKVTGVLICAGYRHMYKQTPSSIRLQLLQMHSSVADEASRVCVGGGGVAGV